MTQTVSAVFDSNTDANRAIENLLEVGIPSDRISTLMSNATRQRYYPQDTAGNAAGWGAGVGAVIGGLIAVASLGVPGGIVVAGPFAALLGGAAAGAVGGGLVGALIGIGIPEERARSYGERVERGGIVVAVEARNVQEVGTIQRALTRVGGSTPQETLYVGDARP